METLRPARPSSRSRRGWRDPWGRGKDWSFEPGWSGVMKFLCVPCDEAMTLAGTEGPEEGPLTVIFACPRCPNKVAMLTNPLETQLVRALDVRLGGLGAPAPPCSSSG